MPEKKHRAYSIFDSADKQSSASQCFSYFNGALEICYTPQNALCKPQLTFKLDKTNKVDDLELQEINNLIATCSGDNASLDTKTKELNICGYTPVACAVATLEKYDKARFLSNPKIVNIPSLKRWDIISVTLEQNKRSAERQLEDALSTYIKTRERQAKDGGKYKTFFGWVFGMSSSLKIKAAQRMLQALKYPDKKIEFTYDELLALQDGDLNKKVLGNHVAAYILPINGPGFHRVMRVRLLRRIAGHYQ